MEIIKKNGKQFYRFKIGDEFTAVSGKGSFNKMQAEGITSKTYDAENGFIYPFYDGSTMKNHIKGYSKEFNFDGIAIKVAKDGARSGTSILVQDKLWNGEGSYLLNSKDFSNEYLSLFMSNLLPSFQAGTVIPHVKFNDYKNEYLEIPVNHKELSKIIKRVNEYKQLSKQLSKQLKDYKNGILQESEKQIKIHQKNGDHDKYISFKIGDEFTAVSGKGSFKEMQAEGNASKIHDEENGFIYPVYSASAASNHVVGWSKQHNSSPPFIKVSISGDPGRSVFVKKKSHLMEKSYAFYSKSGVYMNHFFALLFNKLIPKLSQGSAQKNAYFPNYKNEYLEIPVNHNELSKIINQINKWEEVVNQTTKKMEKYIEGVLELSLEGVNND